MSDAQSLVLLSGGMDLQNPSIAAPKGTLRDCLNVEVGTQTGYQQIGGWMPHDGTVMGPNVRDFLYFPFPLSRWNSINFQYGETVNLTLTSGNFVGSQSATANCIGWIAPSGGGNGTLMLAFVPGDFSEAFYLGQCNVTAATGATSAAALTAGLGVALRKVSDCLLPPATYNAYRTNIEGLHAAAIYPLSGEQTSSPDGAFTYKNVDYALHDCVAFYFRAGLLADTCEGHIIKNGMAQIGIILSVTVTSGGWATSDAAGYVVVYDVPYGVSLPADGTSLNLWAADGMSNLGTWATYDGVSDRSLLRDKTRALLYSASLQVSGESKALTPWERRRLSREIGYTQIGAIGSIGFAPQGDADYSIYEYSRLGLNDQNAQLQPVTTGYKFPQSVTQAGTAWLNPNNIQAQDGAVATNGQNPQTNWIRALNFDFSEIPVGSVVTGLEVVIRRRMTAAGQVRDYSIRLVMPDGTLQSEKADRALLWPTVLTDAFYGGTTDAWGVQLSREILNDPAFGIQFIASNANLVAAVAIDDIKARVTYIPATRLVYIRNAADGSPTDIEARVVHYTRDTGDPTTGDQVGTLTLWFDGDEWDGTSAGKARRIGAGEQIRTAAGGGGSLLANTTGEDSPTSFPCGSAVDAKDAKWQFELANFYADPDAQMVFMANGTEYATMYDETYSVRIRTGRRQDVDTPRHIWNHLGFMHFAFDSGDLINSATFRPVTCDPALGSSLRNVGEPVTGLMTLNGQTLGVWTNRATRGYQGNSPLNYVPIVISPAIGAIEYTVTNLAGTPMWASARGIESVATVSAYGDFQTNPLSYAITPWLQDRLQFDSRVGLVDKRPVMAAAVRNKRQYRLYFRDGYFVNLTLFGVDETPMATVGRLERGSAAAPYNQAPVRHVFSGIRDDGKEAILCCFDRQNPTITGNSTNSGAYPYLTQLDAGRTFATARIPCYIELNPIYPGMPNQSHKTQYVILWANALPGTTITQYSIQRQDIPFVTLTNPNPRVVQPDETVTYLVDSQLPNYSVSFDTATYGPFLRLRYDVSTAVSESVRMTHLVMTTEPQQMSRD